MPRAAGRTPAERRQLLLVAATDVVREHGPRASMEAMAAAGGVTKPILYRHFGDRQGLVDAIGQPFLIELNRAIEAGLREPADTSGASGDGTAVLRATIDAYLALVERDTQLYRFLVQQDASTGNRATSAFTADVAGRVAARFRDGLIALGRDPAPAELWARGIVGMVHAAGDWWAERPSMARAKVVDALTALLWFGLGDLEHAAGDPA